MSDVFVFVGVTTGGSSIMRIFPRWRDALGLGEEVEIVGRDIPLGAPPQAFRDAIAWMRETPGIRGALVTTHKIDVVQHAGALFDALDEHAVRLGEVSCVAIRDGRALGWAKDPITAARSLDAALPERHFAERGGDALVMGAGGAGSAIAHCLLERADGPARVILTDRDPARLRRARELLGQEVGGGRALETQAVEGPHDGLAAALPSGSLVVNATGMGKDRPGSPLEDPVAFPRDGIAWELNYRGELEFWHQAQEARQLRYAEDGWRYFIEGWTAVIEEVFERPIGRDEIPALMEAATFARPRLERAKEAL